MIVISSTGPVFTAGMDLAAFAPRQSNDEDEARRNSIRHGAAFYDTALKTQARLMRWRLADCLFLRPFRVAVSVAAWIWSALATCVTPLQMLSLRFLKPTLV